jgi:hypothetical protein
LTLVKKLQKGQARDPGQKKQDHKFRTLPKNGKTNSPKISPKINEHPLDENTIASGGL